MVRPRNPATNLFQVRPFLTPIFSSHVIPRMGLNVLSTSHTIMRSLPFHHSLLQRGPHHTPHFPLTPQTFEPQKATDFIFCGVSNVSSSPFLPFSSHAAPLINVIVYLSFAVLDPVLSLSYHRGVSCRMNQSRFSYNVCRCC